MNLSLKEPSAGPLEKRNRVVGPPGRGGWVRGKRGRTKCCRGPKMSGLTKTGHSGKQALRQDNEEGETSSGPQREVREP